MISIPVRIRRIGYAGLDEVSTTVDVSRLGFLFVTASGDYYRGTAVKVVFPYAETASSMQAEQQARVVRVTKLSDGRRAVAIAVGQQNAHDSAASPATTASGQTHAEVPPSRIESSRAEPKPLVLALDSETAVLENVKTLLAAEGYEVIAVNNARDGHEILNLFTPAMVIAEIEGEGFPGYTLCAHVKETPRLQRVPVVLVTSGGNPSDYRGAHSLGAIVCMTKPFKNERLLHLSRLLAPFKNPPPQD
ncbi:MAG: response regulator [Candidatus Acidiferrales bacterium]